MKTETRTKNTTRNTIFSMLAYMIQIVLGFLVRRYFIYVFSTEYLGLNSLFSNVLSILSLAELGFGTAIVFAMYKPMAEDNKEEVRQLLQFYKKCYYTIGIIVLALGLCVMPFMSVFKAQAPNVNVNLYVVYAIFLFNTVISYFFSHRRSLIYTSQRNDIESKINIGLNIGISALQLVSILWLKNYYAYICLLGVSNLLNNLIICLVTKKNYAEYLKKPDGYLNKETRKQINKNIYAMLFHKIGTVIVFSTDSLLIYFLLDAATLGQYSNYLLITTYVGSFVKIFTNAVRPSIGNSIASESVEKNYNLYKKLNLTYIFIVAFCTIGIFCLSNPFIDVVLNKSSTALTFDFNVLLVIAINFFCNNIRWMTNVFKETAGLFYQDRFKPLVESVVNLAVSWVLAIHIGVAGVVIGTIASNVLVAMWVEAYVINKHYFKKSTGKYLLKVLYFTLITAITGALTYVLCSLIPGAGIWMLMLKFIACCAVALTLLFAGFCWLPEFKEVFRWGKTILGGVLHKKQVNTVVVPGKDFDGDGIADVKETILSVDNIDVVNVVNESKEIKGESCNPKSIKQKDKTNGG